MIRWERQDNGDCQGYSREFIVATVAKDPDAEGDQWLWTITALKRPKTCPGKAQIDCIHRV
jgi:hypothetical protein